MPLGATFLYLAHTMTLLMRTPRAFALSLLLVAAACGGQVPETDQGLSGDAADQDLAPPIEVVSAGIYRGRRPDAATLSQLKALGVKTILNLEDDTAAVKAERAQVAQLGMSFVSTPMSGFWAPHDATVNAALAHMASQAERPIFVHCLHGEDRTGLIVGLTRIYQQGWTPAQAYKEMIAKGFHKILVFLNHYFETRTGFED